MICVFMFYLFVCLINYQANRLIQLVFHWCLMRDRNCVPLMFLQGPCCSSFQLPVLCCALWFACPRHVSCVPLMFFVGSVLFVHVLWLVYPMLSMFLEFSFLIAPLSFSNVCLTFLFPEPVKESRFSSSVNQTTKIHFSGYQIMSQEI